MSADKAKVMAKVDAILTNDQEGAVGRRYDHDYAVVMKQHMQELLEEDIPNLFEEIESLRAELEKERRLHDAHIKKMLDNEQDRDSWRRVAERLEREKVELRDYVEGMETTIIELEGERDESRGALQHERALHEDRERLWSQDRDHSKQLERELEGRKQGNESLLREHQKALEGRGRAERERDINAEEIESLNRALSTANDRAVKLEDERQEAQQAFELIREQFKDVCRERDEARQASEYWQDEAASLAEQVLKAENANAALLEGLRKIQKGRTGLGIEGIWIKGLANELLAQYDTAPSTGENMKGENT